jgi:hypothetical protein
MMLAQPTRYCSDPQHSCRLIPRKAGARHILMDLYSLAPQMLARAAQPATSSLRAHQILAASQSLFSRHSELPHSHAAAKSP